MLRKLSMAVIATALTAGMAYAAEQSCFPSSVSECGPEAGTTPTTSNARPAAMQENADASCFPITANECGPVPGAPTGQYDRPAVGGTGGEAAMGEVRTPGHGLAPKIDD